MCILYMTIRCLNMRKYYLELIINMFSSAPPLTFRLDFINFTQMSHNSGKVTQDTSAEYG